MTEHEAAKPKRPRDQEFEDAPIQESIRGMSPRVIKRNPSSDQKRVRREMQRKTAGEETELSRLLVEAAASDNPFEVTAGDSVMDDKEVTGSKTAAKPRTRRKALEWLRDKLYAEGDVEHLVVCHGEAPDLDTFLDLIADRYPRDQVRVAKIGAVKIAIGSTPAWA